MSNLSIVVHVMLNANVFVYTWKNNALEKNFDNSTTSRQARQVRSRIATRREGAAAALKSPTEEGKLTTSYCDTVWWVECPRQPPSNGIEPAAAADGSSAGIHEYNLLLSTLEDDVAVGQSILSFISSCSSALGNLELVCKRAQAITAKVWKETAYERFGVRTKRGWINCISLLRKPVFIHIEESREGRTMYYAGSPHVVANSRILAVTTDDLDGSDYQAPLGIGIRDASTLEYLETIPASPWMDWRVSIAGEGNSENFVLSNCREVNAYGRESGWENVLNLRSERPISGDIIPTREVTNISSWVAAMRFVCSGLQVCLW